MAISDDLFLAILSMRSPAMSGDAAGLGSGPSSWRMSVQYRQCDSSRSDRHQIRMELEVRASPLLDKRSPWNGSPEPSSSRPGHPDTPESDSAPATTFGLAGRSCRRVPERIAKDHGAPESTKTSPDGVPSSRPRPRRHPDRAFAWRRAGGLHRGAERGRDRRLRSHALRPGGDRRLLSEVNRLAPGRP